MIQVHESDRDDDDADDGMVLDGNVHGFLDQECNEKLTWTMARILFN